MAEFKFPCPFCSQHIQCDEAYTGAQVNCPHCSNLLTIPSPSGAPVSEPPPPPQPATRPGLATARTTAAPAAGRQFAGAPGRGAAPKKTSALRTMLVVVITLVVLAGLGVGGWMFWTKHQASVVAKKGNPAAQVPVPSATQSAGALGVLAKVRDAYTHASSLTIQGTSVSIIDMSAITVADVDPKQAKNKNSAKRRPPNMPKAMTNDADVVIKLARPDLYRIEVNARMHMGRTAMTNQTAAWSSGKTNFTLMMMQPSIKNYTTVPDHRTAFMSSGQGGGLSIAIPMLFFDEADGIISFVTEWGQTEDDSVNGQECYTLTAKMMGQKLKLWVSKDSYMILQSQITIGAAVTDSDVDAVFKTFNNSTNQTPAQVEQQKAMVKQQVAMVTKIRGTISETYDNIETNKAFSPGDFNYPVPRGTRLTPGAF